MNFDKVYADYLDDAGIQAIQELEKTTGKRILAYYSRPEPASISEDQLAKIRELEDKLCVRLVAFETQ